jgi:hypothetical protein
MGCPLLPDTEEDPGKTTEQPGEINGKALFSNANDHTGITINTEGELPPPALTPLLYQPRVLAADLAFSRISG